MINYYGLDLNANKIKESLRLKAHPEGGYYAETYRSDMLMKNDDGCVRNVCTCIYFMLENNDVSHFHRIKSDETWLFHQGQPLEIISIQNNQLRVQVLGNDICNGESPQVVVPARAWFASRVKGGSGYGLVSCIVAPGFDFVDFEMARKADLLYEYPQFSEIINELAFD